MGFISFMKISTINIQNKYYNNLPAQRPVLNSSKVSDSFSFTGNYERLSRDTMEVVSSISNAYKDILKKISEKTPEGMEIIQKEYKDFKSTRSLMFHNCGENKTSIQVRVPDGQDGRDFIKIVVKKGSNFSQGKVVLDSYTIKDFDRIVEDNDKNYVYVFPQNIKYTNFDKPFELKLQKVLDDLDCAMLKFRKFLAKYDGQYLKPELFTFGDTSIKRLENINSLYNKTDELLKGLSNNLSLKLKKEFEDYKLQLAQPVHILKNIGENKNQIAYKKLQHPEHGELTRIMVYDKNDEIIDGFLLKEDQGLIVSNFNPKYPTIIPPELKYYSDLELEELGLESFLKKAADELQEFKTHIETPIPKMENKVKEIKLTEPKKVIKKEENVKLKSEVISKTKEYKQLMKECNEKLTLAMENAENDMQGFNNVIQEIQSKIAGFFSKTEQ